VCLSRNRWHHGEAGPLVVLVFLCIIIILGFWCRVCVLSVWFMLCTVVLYGCAVLLGTLSLGIGEDGKERKKKEKGKAEEGTRAYL